jgi:hypothetical protein
MDNRHKKYIIFNKKQYINNVEHSNVTPKEVVSDIEKVINNKENIYLFTSGEKAEFLYERSCVNNLSFNYFQIYNQSVYKCFKELSKMLGSLCKINEINTDKTQFWITSEYETEFLEDYWYDSGGIGAPNFCGYWILECKDNAFIKINSTKTNIENGSLVLYESGARTEFYGIDKGISFNIITTSKLIGQYPQKWMPIIPNMI